MSMPIRLAASRMVVVYRRLFSSSADDRVLLQQLREAHHVPQRRPQVVRDRVGERLQLLVARSSSALLLSSCWLRSRICSSRLAVRPPPLKLVAGTAKLHLGPAPDDAEAREHHGKERKAT